MEGKLSYKNSVGGTKQVESCIFLTLVKTAEQKHRKRLLQGSPGG